MDAPKTVKYENKRLSTLGPHIWNSLSKHFKAENDFSKFKKYVMSHKFGSNCRCNLWAFLHNVSKWTKVQTWNRSSHQRCSVKNGVLRNFAKFAGKHLCQRLFLNKLARLRPATLLKKKLWHGCFPVNFAKFLRTPF